MRVWGRVRLLGLGLVEGLGQSRNLSGSCVLVDRSLSGSLHQFLFCQCSLFLRGIEIAGGDSSVEAHDDTLQAVLDSSVDESLLFDNTDSFLSRFDICHFCYSPHFTKYHQ